MNPRFVIFACLLSVCWASSGIAQDFVPPRRFHAWGRFTEGAWRLVRVTTRTSDEERRVVTETTTETRTTLESIDDQGITLRVDVTVEFAGTRFAGEPKYIKQRFRRGLFGRRVRIEQIEVDNRKLASQVHEIVSRGDDGARITTIYLAYNEREPFVLRRVTVAKDEQNQTVQYQTQVDVTALEERENVLDEPKKTWHVRTVHTQKSVKSISEEVHCLDVPGGVVSQRTDEIDQTGRVIRSSTLELMGYGVGPSGGALRPARRGRAEPG